MWVNNNQMPIIVALPSAEVRRNQTVRLKTRSNNHGKLQNNDAAKYLISHSRYTVWLKLSVSCAQSAVMSQL